MHSIFGPKVVAIESPKNSAQFEFLTSYSGPIRMKDKFVLIYG